MPEYLSPGVFIEEVPFEAHDIPGVPTGPGDDGLGSGERERPRYFSGMLLDADDFEQEQIYFREKLRLHNRLLHGWGVVWGLSVAADPSADRPWGVRIEPGLALTPQGDEVILAKPACIDLAVHRPGSVPSLFIGVRYAEIPTRPVSPAIDRCDDGPQMSRIRDAVSLGCLAALPDSYRGVGDEPSLCDAIRRVHSVPCPPRATGTWIVIAEVHLPSSTNEPLGNSNIDTHRHRRLTAATAVLQSEVVRCCCVAGGHKGTSWIRRLVARFRA